MPKVAETYPQEFLHFTPPSISNQNNKLFFAADGNTVSYQPNNHRQTHTHTHTQDGEITDNFY